MNQNVNDVSKYEFKICSRCSSTFECKPGNITQCQCYGVKLTRDEILFIKELYNDCLCVNCLKKLKILYKERKILESFSVVKSLTDIKNS
jgi:hypothetical protein